MSLGLREETILAICAWYHITSLWNLPYSKNRFFFLVNDHPAFIAELSDALP
jgi:hypothetical protein